MRDKERLVCMQRADEIDQADGSPDELEELIAEMTAKDPNFPRLLEEAIERQTLMHSLVQECKRQRVTQKNLAARRSSNVALSSVSKWTHPKHTFYDTIGVVSTFPIRRTQVLNKESLNG